MYTCTILFVTHNAHTWADLVTRPKQDNYNCQTPSKPMPYPKKVRSYPKIQKPTTVNFLLARIKQ